MLRLSLNRGKYCPKGSFVFKVSFTTNLPSYIVLMPVWLVFDICSVFLEHQILSNVDYWVLFMVVKESCYVLYGNFYLRKSCLLQDRRGLLKTYQTAISNIIVFFLYVCECHCPQNCKIFRMTSAVRQKYKSARLAFYRIANRLSETKQQGLQDK